MNMDYLSPIDQQLNLEQILGLNPGEFPFFFSSFDLCKCPQGMCSGSLEDITFRKIRFCYIVQWSLKTNVLKSYLMFEPFQYEPQNKAFDRACSN